MNPTPLWQLCLIVLLSFILSACNQVTEENFEKIRTNMSFREVKTILGKPIHAEHTNIDGMKGLSAVWRHQDKEIDIQFLNDKMYIKTYSNLTTQTSTVS